MDGYIPFGAIDVIGHGCFRKYNNMVDGGNVKISFRTIRNERVIGGFSLLRFYSCFDLTGLTFPISYQSTEGKICYYECRSTDLFIERGEFQWLV